MTIFDKIYAGVYPQLSILTWILYFISLLSTLVSFLTAQITFDEQITCFTALKNEEAYSSNRFTEFQHWTAILNYVSMCTFIIASVFFITFASLNLLNKETNMTIIAQDGLTTNSMTQKILTEGLTPNKANITKIENGLTPNSISKNVITDKTAPQQPNSPKTNSPIPQNLPEDHK